MTFRDRLVHSFNAFMNKDPTPTIPYYGGGFSTYRPDRVRLTRGNERSIVNSVYNRIALDVASVQIMHVKKDENGKFVESVDSDLNNCLTVEPNIDQTARAFIQDVVLSMFDEGVVCIIPVDTNVDPDSGAFTIQSLRTGKITQWMPQHVKVQAYNDRNGKKEEIILAKRNVCIIENPFYTVMNEPNSTVQRLIRKLNILDSIDEQSGAGKLDLIIQLPYSVRSPARKKQAEERRKDIEQQLAGSKYGIAYSDATEHITQLNRSVDNNLMSQIEYLTNLMYSQLGITQSIMDGTADEATMLNYNNRTIEPIVSSIVDEMTRKFLTKTARTQKQSIFFFKDPFKLVPVSQMAEIADKFTRNEIMTSNEIRQVIGMRKAEDPNADILRNKNLSEPSGEGIPAVPVEDDVKNEE